MFTERQTQKMLQQAKANPKTFLDSDSYRVHLADRISMVPEQAGQRSFASGRSAHSTVPSNSRQRARAVSRLRLANRPKYGCGPALWAEREEEIGAGTHLLKLS
jgi:hypothetical protein